MRSAGSGKTQRQDSQKGKREYVFLTLFPYNTLSTVPIGAVEGMILARNRICWSLILVRKPTILSYCNLKKTLC